jgi:UDP-N-acetylmuramoyl-L-alanyl-D-glutamate--2,6-diaminopimelate ligase
VFGAPLPGLGARAGTIADRFFGAPSAALAVAGVTGTNGKTTVAWLLAQCLGGAAGRCGYAGTLGVGVPPAGVEPGEYTTADAVMVHRQLAALADAGATAVAMEVSSHALDQHRVAGVRFRVAGFTNLTRDHLEYHGTMGAYGEAKARLLAWPGLEARVVNVDDGFGAELAARPAEGRLYVTCRGADGAARAQALHAAAGATILRARAVRPSLDGLRLGLELPEGAAELALPLVGEFNADNALTVLGMLLSLGVPTGDALAALAAAAPPPGRMETVAAPGQALGIVDYAHTPDALAKALRAARAHCAGRLHVVFGCGGDRDAGKRPLMGEVAGRLADEVVVTDDNPRGEPSAAISAAIVAGLPAGRSARVIPDRAEAIRAAVAAARPGDVIVVAGKGHEDYQLVGGERRAFSDRRALRNAFAERPS